MCDYSLHNVAARPAKVGDKLVSTRFPNSITRGFAAIGEPNVSVCLPPGTELAFEAEVKYEARDRLPSKKEAGRERGPLPLCRQWLSSRASRRARISQREDRVAHAAV